MFWKTFKTLFLSPVPLDPRAQMGKIVSSDEVPHIQLNLVNFRNFVTLLSLPTHRKLVIDGAEVHRPLTDSKRLSYRLH